MMKSWLAAFGKLLAEFFMLLALFSMAGAFVDTISAPSWGALGIAFFGRTLQNWPYALALTLTTGLVSFAGTQGRPARNILSVGAVGLLLAAAGTMSASLLHVEPSMPPTRPLAGQAVEEGDRLASASAIEGGSARGLVTVDWSLPSSRLGWNSAAVFDPITGTASARGTNWRLVSVRDATLANQQSILPSIGNLGRPLAPDDHGELLPSLVHGWAFVLLCLGLASLALGFRRPMSALVVAVLAAIVSIGLDGWAGAGEIAGRLADFAGGIGVEIGASWMIAAAEFVLAALLIPVGLLLGRRVKS